jgi:hypothetical protein
MKHHFKSFGRCKRLCLAIAIFSLIGIGQGHAQSIQRQSIGTFGANMVSGGILVKQTVGQPYATNTYYQNGIGFQPGFQQSFVAASPSPVTARQLVQPGLSLKVYPNPAAYSLRIESEEAIGHGVLKVVDNNGRLIVNEKVSELKSHSINCESWANGLYLISVTDERNISYSSKLIISK